MKKIEGFLDRITESPLFRVPHRLLIQFGNSPSHLKMAYLGLLWGLLALVTHPFISLSVYQITNTLAPDPIWGASIALACLFHLFGWYRKHLTFYILGLTLECLLWFLVFFAVLLSETFSARLALYFFMMLSASANLALFAEGVDTL